MVETGRSGIDSRRIDSRRAVHADSARSGCRTCPRAAGPRTRATGGVARRAPAAAGGHRDLAGRAVRCVRPDAGSLAEPQFLAAVGTCRRSGRACRSRRRTGRPGGSADGVRWRRPPGRHAGCCGNGDGAARGGSMDGLRRAADRSRPGRSLRGTLSWQWIHRGCPGTKDAECCARRAERWRAHRRAGAAGPVDPAGGAPAFTVEPIDSRARNAHGVAFRCRRRTFPRPRGDQSPVTGSGIALAH